MRIERDREQHRSQTVRAIARVPVHDHDRQAERALQRIDGDGPPFGLGDVEFGQRHHDRQAQSAHLLQEAQLDRQLGGVDHGAEQVGSLRGIVQEVNRDALVGTAGDQRNYARQIDQAKFLAIDANRTLELFGFGASDQVGVTMERLYDRSAAPRGELWSAAAEWVTRLNDPASERGVRVQACLCLLLLATRHWELRRESMTSESAALHTRGRRHRLSLETVSADIRNRAEWSVMSLLEWVVDSYVCSQSLRFALEKLRNGQYRFFIERDEDGYRVVKPDSGRGYLRRDADRLKGALGLLYDLGMTTDAKSPQITAAGKQWWRHLANVHA